MGGPGGTPPPVTSLACTPIGRRAARAATKYGTARWPLIKADASARPHSAAAGGARATRVLSSCPSEPHPPRVLEPNIINCANTTALFLIPLGARPEPEQVVPAPHHHHLSQQQTAAMVMDALELPLSAHLLLGEPPPQPHAPHMPHVLGFDCLYRQGGAPDPPDPPEPRAAPDTTLHTPVTTANDAPSFFGDCPLTVEPPPISGTSKIRVLSENC